MELKIAGQWCDIGEKKISIPDYSAEKLADIEGNREGRSLKLTIPASPLNTALVGDACDPHTAIKFNSTLHRAEVLSEGATLFSGTVRLLASSGDGYLLEIREGGSQWAKKAARAMFNTINIDYRATLSPTVIAESWSNSSPVKFFPIVRDNYPQQNGSTDLLPIQRLMTVDDYHPFLHIAALVKAIFAQSGYRLESRFMESWWFQSLYMSGDYASRDTAALASRISFFARRLSPVTAVADYSGRVTANPDAISNTVGNIVETATPQTLDTDGELIHNLHNYGDCFSVEGGKILYRPTTNVSVGFEYYLKYTTSHRILSRDRLAGFDSIYFGAGSDMKFSLPNRYEDRRNSLGAGRSYLAVVFDHKAGSTYKLAYTLNGVPGTVWKDFSSRTVQLTTAPSAAVSSPVLFIKDGENSWATYPGDWAIYDGFITERGETTVEIRIKTASEHLSPSAPKYFNQIYFYGADSAMSLTLHKECSLKPSFSATPGYGSTITFSDVAQHRVRQIELLQALQHLFNLRFMTDEATKTVRIEPFDDFFAGFEGGTVADWRSKTDFSQPVVLADIAPEIHEVRSWSYRTGDGAVTRFDNENSTKFGKWSIEADSFAVKEGEKESVNPLFCPTINITGHYSNAPSASVMQVGDRDSAEERGTNFTPRIVRYLGLAALPGGERWGYPSNAAEYPLAAFHLTGNDNPFTLCFENRDNIEGLHRYYDRQTAQEATSQRITLSLLLAPHEYETLFTPDMGLPDIRSMFLLDTGRGEVRATLHAIEKYNPDSGIARCTFIQIG